MKNCDTNIETFKWCLDQVQCNADEGNVAQVHEYKKKLVDMYEVALQTIEDLEMELRVAGETD